MAENKYKFNPETLQYEHAGKSKRKKIINAILTQLAAGLIVAVGIFVVFSYVAESKKQRHLKNENKILAQQYKQLIERKKRIDKYVQALKEQDRHIYKSVFETNPEYDNKQHNYLEEYSSENMAALCDSNTAALQKAVDILDKQNSEYERIIKLLSSQDERYSSIPAIQPLYNPNLTLLVQGFGTRIEPFYKSPVFHEGIDYAAPEGTKVFATADGVVKKAKRKKAYGNLIEIDHGNGYVTIYAHLKSFECRKGQKIKRGDLIGYVGGTGKSFVPHLHYEIRYNGKAVNPVSYFFMDLTPQKYEEMRYTAAKAGQSLD